MHFLNSLTEYEDPRQALTRKHSESWFDANVWSVIIDYAFRNISELELIRYVNSCNYNYFAFCESDILLIFAEITESKRIKTRGDSAISLTGFLKGVV